MNTIVTPRRRIPDDRDRDEVPNPMILKNGVMKLKNF